MSEQDKNSGGGSGGPVVVVDKTSSSRHRSYRPNELHDEPAPDLRKRSKAPAVPSVAEELKDATITDPAVLERLECERALAEEIKDATITDPAVVERLECERALTCEKHRHVPKNKSATSKRRGSSPENKKIVPLDSAKKDMIGSSPAPIPAQVEKLISDEAVEKLADKLPEKKVDDDSITEEITELRTPEAVVKEHSQWSDDEEAGGLPRTESRASRAYRAVRQLFCCGVAHDPPSEEKISPREFSAL